MVDDVRPEPPNGRGGTLEFKRAPTVAVAAMIVVGSALLFFAGRGGGHPTPAVGMAWVQMGNRWVDTSQLTWVKANT